MTGVALSWGTPFSPWQAEQACAFSSMVCARASVAGSANTPSTKNKHVILRRSPALPPGRLEGWKQPPCLRPSFETVGALAELLRMTSSLLHALSDVGRIRPKAVMRRFAVERRNTLRYCALRSSLIQREGDDGVAALVVE